MLRAASWHRVVVAVGLLLLPACRSAEKVRPVTPREYQTNATPPEAEAPRPLLSYHPVSRVAEPVPVVPPFKVELLEPPALGEEPSEPVKTHPVEPPLLLALRSYMIDRRPDDAIERLRPYDKANQEFLIALIPPLARAAEGDLSRADPTDVAALLEQLQTATAVLKSRAALRIDVACFCRKVVRFGIFDPIGENHSFRPGEMAEMYVELRNVVGEPLAEAGRRGIRTRLATEMVLRDGANKLVWREDCDRDEFARSARHDLDLHYRFCVPSLPAGNYTLSVRIVDQTTNRAVTRSLDFRVATMPVPAM